MSDSRPTVAIIDPIWVGHHPMYFAQFSASFLRNGARVIGICPAPDEAREGIREILPPEVSEKTDSHLFLHLIKSGKRSLLNNRYEGDPIHTFQRWQRAGQAVSIAENLTHWQVDLVFFPYIDAFLRVLPFSAIPSITLGKPWSGLYLRNHHHGEKPSFLKHLRTLAKGDALMKSPLCLEIGVLDERFNAALETLTGKQVVSYPDVTHTTLPGEPSELARRIIAAAGGRKIIGVIGLEPRKGIINMMRVAHLAAEKNLPLYFVFAGKIAVNSYGPEERHFLEQTARGILAGEIHNIHFGLQSERIGEETDFNSLFHTFDVAWAAYENFQGSSGTLSKAAAFDIPVIASAGECIGQRVETFRTGLTIPPGDSKAALHAIQRLIEDVDWKNEPLHPDYNAYRGRHSIERLDAILANLLRSLDKAKS